MDMLRVPLEARGRGFRVVVARGVELLVLSWAEPGPVHDFALRAVGRGKIRQVGELAAPYRGFQHKAQRHDFIVQGAARRRGGFGFAVAFLIPRGGRPD